MIVAVVGPTATGKSDLALDLAEALSRPSAPAEIVNADAFQLYRGMDVGTAKVPPAERRGIVHHQLDVLDPTEDASVARYQTAARADLDAVAARGARAVVVGGSGLYVRALLDHMEFPGTDPEVRTRLEERAETEGPRALHAELARLDPGAAESIGPANTRRLVRALEVVEITGRPFTANLPRQEYVRPAVQIGLDCDRPVLDARVAGRVERMWSAGLVEEVRSLASPAQGGTGGGLGTTAARAVGYAELLRWFAGDLTEAEAREAVVTNTRRLARKQMGWFGRDPRVHWLDAGSPTLVEDALALVRAADADELPVPEDRPVRRSLGS
ncbi:MULTISPECIES: tRNA (adenosine(37)-N6)-dimethylallyltransferase MiaA [unclassified Isoptericola]|uniref:tRNA (adenosine(37)-N6)-dimethylallyltransferase MiaA n=1 Tax=unclassified Isoptericola TaxID=2623355 RepID=UPI0027133188|nr:MULTISPECIES: tRNA (adenosine(37)-N6)-dimethylallyltransferase MiaA [unclassified Isoptericola]MDO8144634.1 tRNA (adenosine(37)-N6)-dimethylallyltransferase MiaA [Isoptericola sp. 178]MDO8148480.1 tRNA (adenosine(37)-N6)-dimethylallyltransferase MiaA [Isoptericola sp. b515]MDO8151959.1 tRNA (adenosine(37)-N6)-dimethylallyltransferase MiaA [Isoptericola sp. b408]